MRNINCLVVVLLFGVLLCGCSSSVSEPYRLVKESEQKVNKDIVNTNKFNLIQSLEVSSDDADVIANELANVGCINISDISINKTDTCIFVKITDIDNKDYRFVMTLKGTLCYLYNSSGDIAFMSSTITTNIDKLVSSESLSKDIAESIALSLADSGCGLITSVSSDSKTSFAIKDNKSKFIVELSSGGYVSSVRNDDGDLLYQSIE